MSDSDQKDKGPSEIEREIRRGRKFSVTEAVGREAAGALKGASPVARAKQVLLEIEQALNTHLADPEGSLRDTLLAQLEGNTPLLGRHFEDPLGALRAHVDQALDTPSILETLVRQTDARWGRTYGERPYFETPGQPPHPDDPYTLACVRERLSDLRDRL